MDWCQGSNEVGRIAQHVKKGEGRNLGKDGRSKLINAIRMDLEEICINAGNWVDSSQDWNYWRALVNAVLNLWVP